MTAADLVIEALADAEAARRAENEDLREANRQLIDLVADLTFENDRLRRGFQLVLTVVDDARLVAQRERDAALAHHETEAA